MLTPRGHNVRVYTSGADALKGIETHGADLVISELTLPDMAGDELCSELRARHGASAPTFLVLTGATDEDEVASALAAGARHVLGKPLVEGPFLAIVAYLSRANAPTKNEFGSGVKVGPYVIIDELGRGGMGIVFRARKPGAKEDVALKVRTSSGLGRDTDRFLRELGVLAGLEHPGIARLLDTGIDDRGRAYYAMELVPGHSLADEVIENGALKWPRVALIARDVGETLGYLHANQVLHRDVKPGNIVLAPGAHPRLIDFGLARGKDDPILTEENEVLGTTQFLAPEVVDTGRFSPAADIFGLGITLQEALLGAQPVPTRPNQPFEITSVYRQGRIPKLVIMAPNIPRAMAQLLDRMVAPKPEERPSALDVAEQFAEILKVEEGE